MLAIKPMKVSALSVECYRPTRSGTQKLGIARYVYWLRVNHLFMFRVIGDEHTDSCYSHVSVLFPRCICLTLV